MKKKITLTLLALVCALCCALGLAACGDGNNTNEAANYLSYRLKDDDTYAAYFTEKDWTQIFIDRSKNGWTSITFTIPAEYKGKPVTSIDRIGGNDIITSITIPDSVTSIDNQAFDGWSALKSVTIGNGIKTIGNSAFNWCTNLTSVTIPDSVTSIGDSAFSGCKELTSIIIPYKVTSIGNSAFSGCEKLTSVIIQNGVTSIGSGVFVGCGITSLELPGSLTKIEYGALEGCAKLESLTLKFPETHPTLREIFGTSSRSLKTLTVRGGMLNIDGSDGGFTALKNVILYDGVYLQRDNVFDTCPSLEYNEYENGLYLGNGTDKYSFLIKAKNTDIVSFTIHESTNTICSSAFRNCDKLTTVEVSDFEFRKANSKTEKISLKELFNLGQETSTVKTIKVANGVTYMPEKATYFALTELILPNTLTEIAGNAILSEQITTITYKGTKAQFKQIEMNWGWCGGISEINSGATIHCDDGDIFVSWYGQISDK